MFPKNVKVRILLRVTRWFVCFCRMCSWIFGRAWTPRGILARTFGSTPRTFPKLFALGRWLTRDFGLCFRLRQTIFLRAFVGPLPSVSLAHCTAASRKYSYSENGRTEKSERYLSVVGNVWIVAQTRDFRSKKYIFVEMTQGFKIVRTHTRNSKSLKRYVSSGALVSMHTHVAYKMNKNMRRWVVEIGFRGLAHLWMRQDQYFPEHFKSAPYDIPESLWITFSMR